MKFGPGEEMTEGVGTMYVSFSVDRFKKLPYLHQLRINVNHSSYTMAPEGEWMVEESVWKYVSRFSTLSYYFPSHLSHSSPQRNL